MSIKAFFWNVRGLNISDKHRPFARWLSIHKPLFGAILETHIKEPQLNQVLNQTCAGWNYYSNHQHDPDGRVILIWKHPAVLTPIHQSSQSITCKVSIPGNQTFYFSAIYAENLEEDRADLWVELLDLHQSLSLDSHPWIMGGDFNQIIHPSEHSDPSVSHLTTDMCNLRDCLFQMGLFDLKFEGPLNTWINKQPVKPIGKKLDRLLSNMDWISSYPKSLAYFLPPEFSDHSPCLLNLDQPLPSSGTKPFKFLNFLTKHPDFLSTMEGAWEHSGNIMPGNQSLSALSVRLKELKRDLKHLNRENFSQISKRVSETNSLLQSVQVQAFSSPSQDLFQQERDLILKLTFLKSIEESYFKQRSKIHWLKEGDQNTGFFHKTTQQRNSYNAIRKLTDSSGFSTEDPEQMSNLAVRHFQEVLSPSTLPPISCSISWLKSLSSFRCSPESSALLSSLPTAEEIKKALNKIHPNKAPGPDGYTSQFFKSTWSILGADVISGIKSYFQNPFMPTSTKSTILSLIPKKPGSTLITDYRPISCCNTIYKMISHLLVSRLKPILPIFIKKNQTAFIQGRLLMENTLLASEIVNGYQRNKGPQRVTIKIDIAKAFDSIRWEFLFCALRSLDCPEDFLRRLQGCICTGAFSVGYNGSIHGFFKGRRGLRQGDPLSPYLFVIAMNFLSMLLDKGAEEGRFGYHPKCSLTKTTHLCFADDLLIFSDGDIDSIRSIFSILHQFEEISGLKVSLQKTSFYTSGLSPQEIQDISSEFGIIHGKLPVRYLGLPLCTKKLTIQDCAPLIQKVKIKLNGWAAKNLSFAGRLQLLKSVISGITCFWTSTFSLPKRCIKIINSLSSAFLWKGNTEGYHSARVAWNTITLPLEEGGLGLRDLLFWNKASCLKLIWTLFFKAGSIWVAWVKNEMLGGSLSNFWIIKQNPNHSWIMKRLMKLRDIAFPWITLTVGNGQSCRFWSDNWSPWGNLLSYMGEHAPRRMGIRQKTILAELWTGTGWDIAQARTDEQLQLLIHLSTLSLQNVPDGYKWSIREELNSKSSTSTIYNEIRQKLPEVNWKHIVWFSIGIPKHKFLTWLFILNRSPTKDRIRSWGLNIDPTCVLCGAAEESRDHLFFECDYSWWLWRKVAERCRFNPSRSWTQTVDDLIHCRGGKAKKGLTKLAWQATVYALWTERNSRIHRSISTSADSLALQLDRLIKNKALSLRDSSELLGSAIMQLWLSTLN